MGDYGGTSVLGPLVFFLSQGPTLPCGWSLWSKPVAHQELSSLDATQIVSASFKLSDRPALRDSGTCAYAHLSHGRPAMPTWH